MRVKFGEYITEVEQVWVRTNEIVIKQCFYQTGKQTENLAQQLLEKGYVDLSSFECR